MINAIDSLYSVNTNRNSADTLKNTFKSFAKRILRVTSIGIGLAGVGVLGVGTAPVLGALLIGLAGAGFATSFYLGENKSIGARVSGAANNVLNLLQTGSREVASNFTKLSENKKNLSENFYSALENVEKGAKDEVIKAHLQKIDSDKVDENLSLLKERHKELNNNSVYQKENKEIGEMLNISNTAAFEKKANEIKARVGVSESTQKVINLLVELRKKINEQKTNKNQNLVKQYIETLKTTLSNNFDKECVTALKSEIDGLDKYLQSGKKDKVNNRYEQLDKDLNEVIKTGKYSPNEGFSGLGATDPRKAVFLTVVANVVQQTKIDTHIQAIKKTLSDNDINIDDLLIKGVAEYLKADTVGGIGKKYTKLENQLKVILNGEKNPSKSKNKQKIALLEAVENAVQEKMKRKGKGIQNPGGRLVLKPEPVGSNQKLSSSAVNHHDVTTPANTTLIPSEQSKLEKFDMEKIKKAETFEEILTGLKKLPSDLDKHKKLIEDAEKLVQYMNTDTRRNKKSLKKRLAVKIKFKKGDIEWVRDEIFKQADHVLNKNSNLGLHNSEEKNMFKKALKDYFSELELTDSALLKQIAQGLLTH